MPDCERTADSESEGALGEGFLSEVVTLPWTVMALEAMTGVSISPSTPQ